MKTQKKTLRGIVTSSILTLALSVGLIPAGALAYASESTASTAAVASESVEDSTHNSADEVGGADSGSGEMLPAETEQTPIAVEEAEASSGAEDTFDAVDTNEAEGTAQTAYTSASRDVMAADVPLALSDGKGTPAIGTVEFGGVAYSLNPEDSTTMVVTGLATEKPSGTLEIQSQIASSGTVYPVVGISVNKSAQVQAQSSEENPYLVERFHPNEIASGVTSLSIPASVVSIDPAFFQLFPAAGSIEVAKGNSIYVTFDGALYTADGSSLLVVPEGKSGILTVPSTLSTIPEGALSRCQNLTALESASDDAVLSYRDGIAYSADGTTLMAAPADLGTAATIDASCTHIASAAFAGNTALRTLLVDGTMETIAVNDAEGRKAAFEDQVVNEASVVLRVEADNYDTAKQAWVQAGFQHFADPAMPGDVIEPAEGSGFAFEMQDDFTLAVRWQGDTPAPVNLQIPAYGVLNSVQYRVAAIADEGFKDQGSIERVEMPAGLSHIGTSAFEGATMLATAIMPTSLISVGNRAFAGCESLIELELNEGLSFIGAAAFEDIAQKAIIIPASVKYIGDAAFAHAPNLVTVVALGTVAEVSATALSGTTGVSVYVPYVEDEAYEWSVGAVAQGNHLYPFGVKTTQEPIKIEVGETADLFEGGYLKAAGDFQVDYSYKAKPISVTDEGIVEAKDEGASNVEVTLTLAVPKQTARGAVNKSVQLEQAAYSDDQSGEGDSDVIETEHLISLSSTGTVQTFAARTATTNGSLFINFGNASVSRADNLKGGWLGSTSVSGSVSLSYVRYYRIQYASNSTYLDVFFDRYSMPNYQGDYRYTIPSQYDVLNADSYSLQYGVYNTADRLEGYFGRSNDLEYEAGSGNLLIATNNTGNIEMGVYEDTSNELTVYYGVGSPSLDTWYPSGQAHVFAPNSGEFEIQDSLGLMLQQNSTYYDISPNINGGTYNQNLCGWALAKEPDANGLIPLLGPGTYRIINSSLALYPVFKGGGYAISVSGNGYDLNVVNGSNTSQTSSESIYAPQYFHVDGTKLSVLSDGGNDFRTFSSSSSNGLIGWSISNSTDLLDNGYYTTQQRQTITAKYATAHRISFNANGGVSGVHEPVYAVYGKYPPAIENFRAPTWPGYEFAGFYYGSVKYYDKDGAVCHAWDRDAETTLTAKWNAHHYYIDYNANGGSGTMSSTYCTYDSSTNLSSNTFTREGYDFAGWARNSASTSIEFADRASVSHLVTDNNGHITLYAVWQKNNDFKGLPFKFLYKSGSNVEFASGTIDARISWTGSSYINANSTEKTVTVEVLASNLSYDDVGWAYVREHLFGADIIQGWKLESTAYASAIDISAEDFEKLMAGKPVTIHVAPKDLYLTNSYLLGENGTLPKLDLLTDAIAQQISSSSGKYLTTNFGLYHYSSFTSSGGVGSILQGSATAEVTWTSGYTSPVEGGENNVVTIRIWKSNLALYESNWIRARQALASGTEVTGFKFPYEKYGLTLEQFDDLLANRPVTITCTAYDLWYSGGGSGWPNGLTLSTSFKTTPNAKSCKVIGAPFLMNFNQGGSSSYEAVSGTVDADISWTGSYAVGADATSAVTIRIWNSSLNKHEAEWGRFLNAIPQGEVIDGFGFINTEGIEGSQILSLKDFEDLLAGKPITITTTPYNLSLFNSQIGNTSGSAASTDIRLAIRAHTTTAGRSITMDANGGTPTSQAFSIAPGSKLLEFVSPTAPTLTGYTFAGWYTARTDGDLVDRNTLVTLGSPATYYAHWNPISYSVQFNANGGSGTMDMQRNIFYDSTIALRANTYKRNGYRFVGWSLTPDGAVVKADRATADRLTTTANTTVNLYAKWELCSIYVKLDLNDETQPNRDLALINEFGGSAALPLRSDVTRTGYKLLGWSYTKDAATPDFSYNNGEMAPSFVLSQSNISYAYTNTSIMPAHHAWLYLYAVWQPVEYLLSFQGAGVAGAPDDVVVNLESPTASWTYKPQQSGYSFLGWSLGSDAATAQYTDSSFTLTSDIITKYEMRIDDTHGVIILYAVQSAKTDTPYTVSHYLQNAEDDGYTLIASGAERRAGTTDAKLTAADVMKQASDLPGFTCVTPTNTEYTIKGDGSLNIELKYDRNVHKVNYQFAEGTPAQAPAVPASADMRYGANVSVPQVALRGYTVAWTNGAGTPVSTAFTMPDSDVTLTATFTPITYTVVFYADEEELGRQELTFDKEDTLRTDLAPEKQYHSFIGWSDRRSGGTVFDFGTAYTHNLTDTPGTISLYAQWRGNPVTVAFDANGGTGIMSSIQVASCENTRIAAENLAFTRSEYDFLGFSRTRSQLAEFIPSEDDGSLYINVSEEDAVDGTVTLYAIWQPQIHVSAPLAANATLTVDAVTGEVLEQSITMEEGYFDSRSPEPVYVSSITSNVVEGDEGAGAIFANGWDGVNLTFKDPSNVIGTVGLGNQTTTYTLADEQRYVIPAHGRLDFSVDLDLPDNVRLVTNPTQSAVKIATLVYTYALNRG